MKKEYSKKYPLLNEKEWLYKKYIEEKMSTLDIAKLLDIKSCASVKRALEIFGIPLRNMTDGKICKRSKEYVFNIEQQVIDGCLLGDAFLIISKGATTKNYPAFGKNNIYYDHQKFVGQKLFGDNWEDRLKEYPNPGFNNKYKSKNLFHLRGLVDKNLAPFYKRWYPVWNNFNKVIPNDIIIDRTLLLHWFLDDGYSYIVNRKYKNSKYNKQKIRIEFATQSFNKEELEMLSQKIYNKFNLIITPRLHKRNGIVKGSGYEMCLSETKEQTHLFYDIIGECPIHSMEYKWKI